MWNSFLNMWIWQIFYVQSLNMIITEVVSIANTFRKKDKLDKVYFPFLALFCGNLPAGQHADSLPPARNLQCIPSTFSVLLPNKHAPRGLWCVFTGLLDIDAFVSAVFERWWDYSPIYPLQKILIFARHNPHMTSPKPGFWNTTGKEHDMEIERRGF